MRHFYVLLLVAMLSGMAAGAEGISYAEPDSCYSASATCAGGPADGRPVLTVDCETADLGAVRKGESRRHVFHLTNTGSAPLVLLKVYSSCRCTAAEYPNDPVMPGDTASVVVTFDSQGRSPGYFTKLVRIRSNADTLPRRLYIKGRIVE